MKHHYHRIFTSFVFGGERTYRHKRVPPFKLILRRWTIRPLPVIACARFIFCPAHRACSPMKFFHHSLLCPIRHHLRRMIIQIHQHRLHHFGQGFQISSLFKSLQIHLWIERRIKVPHAVDPFVVRHHKLTVQKSIIIHNIYFLLSYVVLSFIIALSSEHFYWKKCLPFQICKGLAGAEHY